MLPQFGATASSLTKMSALVTGVGTDASIYDDPQDADIPTLLDSRYDADKAQGLKRIIAFMAQGRDVSNYFPQVVKGVASQSLEVKKLVYIYLVHYADRRAEEALLSINSFQRDLSDINPMVRAWALRAMSGIRMRVVVPLVVLALNKCARDPSPYVRKCAAISILKVHSMDDEQHFDALVELISLLLNDNDAGVVGAAAAAFLTVCPDKLPILKPSFRRICSLLPDVDEWGQGSLMEILLNYTIAKGGLPRDALGRFEQVSADMTIDDTDEAWEVKLLLSSSNPLLWSLNSAVALQATKIHWFLLPAKDLNKFVKPLIFLLRSSYAAQNVVLADILSFSKSMPSLFESYYDEFFITTADTEEVQALKLDILTNIVTDDTLVAILQELEAYIRNPNPHLAANAVNAVGRCAMRLSTTASICTKGLLMLITSSSGFSTNYLAPANSNKSCSSGRSPVVVQAVLALRAIVQRSPADREQILLHLLKNLDHVEDPAARAVVIWMLGEHGFSKVQAVPVLLRYLARTFSIEADETKLQILLSFAKIVLRLEETYDDAVLLALEYVLNLASCDSNYDIRDRARMLRMLIAGRFWSLHREDPRKLSSEFRDRLVGEQKETGYYEVHSGVLSALALSLLQSPKVLPVLPSLSSDNSSFLPGTISQIVGHMAPGYRPLPTPRPESFADSGSRDSSSEDQSTKHSGTDSDYGSSGKEVEGYSTESDIEGRASADGGDLISLSDGEAVTTEGIEDVMGSVDLEAWLEPSAAPPGFVPVPLTISRHEPRKVLALDFTNGDGLEVQYCFTRNASSYSPSMVSIRLFFYNRSTEVMGGISVKDVNSREASDTEELSKPFEFGGAKIIPAEAVPSLEPGERAECDLHVDFSHSLKPISLAIQFSAKRFPIKISPEAGVLVGPHTMTLDEFRSAEPQYAGMHQSSRKITIRNLENHADILRKAEVIGSSLLSSANVSFVAALSRKESSRSQGPGEILLYFGGQTLTGSLLCLISISVAVSEAGNVTAEVRVSCDDALFGLALLNQLDKALVASAGS